MMPVTKRITDYNKNRDPFFLKIKYKALTELPRGGWGDCEVGPAAGEASVG